MLRTSTLSQSHSSSRGTLKYVTWLKILEKRISSFNRFRKSLKTFAVFYLSKCQIRPEIKYCRHIWAGPNQFPYSSFDRIQNGLRVLAEGMLILHSVAFYFHIRNVTNLLIFYPYFHDKCSD